MKTNNLTFESIKQALSECRDQFERANCLAMIRLAVKESLPERAGLSIGVTVRLVDGGEMSAILDGVASVDAAVGLIRGECRERGIEYTCIESRVIGATGKVIPASHPVNRFKY